MTEVMINVSYHRPVGAFMTALARTPEASWPTTVEGLMQAIAAYLNAHYVSRTLVATEPSPDLSAPGAAPVAGTIAAEFVPDTEGDDSPGGLGTWRVHPFIDFAHVERGATLELRRHKPGNVVIRLPELNLLEATEREASLLSHGDDADRMTGPSYYYDYLGQGTNMTSMEYFWSRIADYTTASCR